MGFIFLSTKKLLQVQKFRGLISDILENQGLIKFIKDSNNESVLLITDRGKMI